jgi:hypothetical protein
VGILFLVQIRFFPSSRSVFLFISPLLFDSPKTTFFRFCTIFISPETPVYYSQNTSILFTKYQFIIHKIPSRRRKINNKRGSIDNTYIKRKLRTNKKKTTRKTRKNNAQNTKKTSEMIQKISNVFRKKSNVFQEISHVF